DDAGLGGVIERTVPNADDIGADNFVFGIAKAFVGGGFHGGVDFLDGDLLVEHGDEFSERAGECGDALGATVKFTFKFREDKADRFCSAGAVGYDVDGCGAGAAEVAFRMGSILRVLVVGISMGSGLRT